MRLTIKKHHEQYLQLIASQNQRLIRSAQYVALGTPQQVIREYEELAEEIDPVKILS
ncbi:MULTISPECIES: hypothetical protein [unclassified Tolypothrix]|uniref:hypothetical protein n=1 Tax=unclassified Tolypothrix TaxID=2649714 RepID=UPI0005EAAA2D|nr:MULTISPECIES: hypothetical protein [unclassified Tolypothrix]BAY92583.1 hypothetical protein NIES3275_46190 [Microchaete diplosiphon NIES-3275]EKF05663.1 hypothetical protein FDUTEX481_00518 [Tolypothrix sp. PCC 7601]MBE9084035.1 hypothetical protein [Tolypothrix sp. LEGE 11397]UYD26535.1 hypothetical protein HGR01_35545 [Tolypothrix sp. PCC 7712]UYD31228.1 hypothetical protein HG267_18935 [Tolypothrix sp. PCC 7601]